MKSIIDLKKCTWQDWATTAVYILICLIITGVSYLLLKSEGDERMEVIGKHSLETENSVILVFSSVIIGFLSSILGIGGATLLTPLLNYLGFAPSTNKATNVFLIFLSKATSVLVFIVLGVLQIDYFLIVGSISMICVMLAEWRLSIYINKMGR